MDAKIKIIDVYGSFDNKGEMHHYTYCTSDYSLDSGWTQHVSDLRTELAPRAGFYYCSWCTKEGWWISKVIPNPHDSRKDPVMLSVCIGKCRPKHGSKAVALLDSFVDFFIIQKIWNDKETEKKLLCDDQELELFACDVYESAMPALTPNSAYRTYESQDELFNYLSFLPQPGYEKYSRIFFVPKENSNGMPIECIDETLPLRRIYRIIYPEGCSSPSGKTEIMDGEDLVLVYTKHGVEPYEKVIRGGENSDFAYVEGDSIIIRSGKDIGLVHNRVIEIICKDKTGKRIEDFSLRNHTQQNDAIALNGNRVIIPENNTQDVIVRIDPKDSQYESPKVNLKDVKDGMIEVSLESKKYKVVFKMNDEVFETIETMNPSEVKAKWGDYDYSINEFDGIVYFRAHRIKNEGKHQFVNGDKDLPIGKRIGNFFKDWWLHLLIVLLTLLLLGYGIYAAVSLFWNGEKPWPFGTKIEKVVDEPEGGRPLESAEVKNEDKTKQDEEKVDSTVFFVQQDIDYLKDNDVWARDKIKSKKFQDMFDNLVNGRYELLISQNDSLFGENVKQNGYYKDIIKRLRILAEQGENVKLTEAAKVMKKGHINGSIDLVDIQKLIKGIMMDGQSSNQQNQGQVSSNKTNNASSHSNNTAPQRPNSN